MKVWTDMLADTEFLRLKSAARLTFQTCIIAAGRCDRGGALLGRTGPVTSKEIAFWTGLDLRVQEKSLEDLVKAQFLSVALDGAWTVLNWETFQPPEVSTKRVREFRKRQGNRVETVSPPFQSPDTRVRVEEEEEEDTPSTTGDKSPSVDAPIPPEHLPTKWPTEIDAMKRLAVPFLAAFGNCKSADAKKKHGAQYIDVLSAMRGRRGVTPAIAWAAFCDAFLARNGKPLFGSSAKSALSYLPAPESARHTEGEQRSSDLLPEMT